MEAAVGADRRPDDETFATGPEAPAKVAEVVLEGPDGEHELVAEVLEGPFALAELRGDLLAAGPGHGGCPIGLDLQRLRPQSTRDGMVS